MAKLLKIFAVLAVVVAACLPGAAFARSHVFLGFNFGYPAYGYGYYPPPYYYYPPPPVYYAPPPVVYYQPPEPVYAGPTYAAPAQNCRTFNGDATIDASGQPFYGTACLGSDGQWHITQ